MATNSAAATPAPLTLPTVIHWLQTESSRYERDRNYWELERAEMKARIAKLEGERKGTDRMKDWYLRRLRMMESALQEERLKNDPNAVPLPSVIDAEHGERKPKHDKRIRTEHDEAYAEIIRTSQAGLKSQAGRTKSRTYLEKCLTEVTYLVNSYPSITANKLADTSSPSHMGSTDHADSDSAQNVSGPRPLKNHNPVRYPSPSPISVNPTQNVEPLVVDGNDYTDVGRPLVDISHGINGAATDATEPVELIRHTYDSNGNFIEPVPPIFSDPPSSNSDSRNLDITKSRYRQSTPGQDSISPRALDEITTIHDAHRSAIEAICSFEIERELWFAFSGIESQPERQNGIVLHKHGQSGPILTLRGHVGRVGCLVAHPQAESRSVILYSAGEDLVIRKWVVNLSHPQSMVDCSTPTTTFISHSLPICGLALVETRLISASEDGSIRKWDVDDGNSLGVWWPSEKDKGVTPTALCHLEGTTFAAGYTNGYVKLHNIDEEKSILTLKRDVREADDLQAVTALVSAGHEAQKLLIIGHNDSKVRLYNVDTKSETDQSRRLGMTLTTLCCNETYIICGQENHITAWTMDESEVQTIQFADEEAVASVSSHVMADGSPEFLLVGGTKGTIRIYTRG